MSKENLDKFFGDDKKVCDCCGRRKPMSAIESIAANNRIRATADKAEIQRKEVREWRKKQKW